MMKQHQDSSSSFAFHCIEKLIGFTFLASYLWLMSWIMMTSSTSSSSIISSSFPSFFPSIVHAKIVLCCSLINMISHLAAVLNLLQEALVINILIGVGFDIISSSLYLYYTARFAATFTTSSNSNNILMMCIILGFDLAVHLRAIFLFTSLERLKSVVTSATNNLKGQPGPYLLDHLFAYSSDIGKHIFYFYLSFKNCGGWKRSVQIGMVVVSILIIGVSLYRWFLVVSTSTKPATVKQFSSSAMTPTKPITSATLSIQKVSNNKARNTNGESSSCVCNCQACQNQTFLSILPQFCDLWFCTFEEILDKIEQATTTITTPHVAATKKTI